METKTGIITNVLPKFKKDGKSVYLNIEMQDGFKVNNFNAMPGDFEVGDTVEYSGETPEGGKYWNLADMDKTDAKVPVEKPGEAIQPKEEATTKYPKGWGAYHLTIEEIRCRALEMAFSLKEPATDVYATAEMFEKWITRE